MTRKNRIRRDNLGRFMRYILGHRPDEFGLVPDGSGFVPCKELLWALHEEPGWAYVRQGHINEVLLGEDRGLFECEENRIRALDRRWRPAPETPAEDLPPVLFTGVRRRAHAHVMEKGLQADEGRPLVLSPSRDMALRIGRRRDPKAVLLEIAAASAAKEGCPCHAFGELFLAREIPVRFISGPPLPKESLKPPKEKKEKKPEPTPDFQAGTFLLDLDREPGPRGRSKGKKPRGWKEDARRMRKRSEK